MVTWTTEYYQLAVEQLRAGGRQVPDEVLAHISPAHSENVNFFGVISVDIEAELAKLDASGRRPLRAGDLGSAGFPAELTIRNKVLPSAAIWPWCGQRGPSSLRLWIADMEDHLRGCLARLRAGRWQSHSICTQWKGGRDSAGKQQRHPGCSLLTACNHLPGRAAGEE